MHNYLSHTSDEQTQMLSEIGVDSIEDLFRNIPESLQNFELNLPSALSELELNSHLKNLSRKSKPFTEQLSFIGGGAYHHFSPAALDLLITRSEFLTAYTPYQAEISQGTLQSIFEFQSMLCSLTGMEIANASLYEGATATVEAMMMAMRITRKKKIYVSESLHPEYRQVVQTYMKAMDENVHWLPMNQGLSQLPPIEDNSEAAALVIQYPNFLGYIEDLEELANWIHSQKGLLIVIMNDPTVLGALTAPGDFGADIVAGEAHAFGNAISFGGPYVGFLTSRTKHIRQMPGRMSGLTQDKEGQRAFSLILQTREQHIRRERATSNVCTNQGLNALVVAIWLTLLGKQGLPELARICFQRAHACVQKIIQIPGFRLYQDHPFFHEFVIETEYPVKELLDFCHKRNCLPGLELSRWHPELTQHILITVTEMNSLEQVNELSNLFHEFAKTKK